MAKRKKITNNTALVKKTNVELVRSFMRDYHEVTRNDVAHATGLSVATAKNILNEMLETGEVFEGDLQESQGGRPSRAFCYNKNFEKVCGICIQYDSSVKTMEYVVSNSFNEIIEKEKFTYDTITYDTVSELINAILKKHKDIKAVAISIPGVSYKGIIQFSDIPELVGTPLEKKLNEEYEFLVSVEDISRVSAYGYYNLHPEYTGKSLAVILAPKDLYLGAGIIINGQVIRGDMHLAGEISYISNGLNRSETLNRMSDNDFFKSTIVSSITSIISVVNPTKIIISGGGVSKDMEKEFIDACHELIPVPFAPEIEVITGENDFQLHGLMKMAFDSLSTGVKLIEI